MLTLLSNAPEPWATSIDPYNGHSYIQVAEDLASDRILTCTCGDSQWQITPHLHLGLTNLTHLLSMGCVEDM